jgi:hypothetical protein
MDIICLVGRRDEYHVGRRRVGAFEYLFRVSEDSVSQQESIIYHINIIWFERRCVESNLPLICCGKRVQGEARSTA